MDVLYPVIVVGIVGAAALAIAALRLPSGESRWLLIVLLAAFGLRLACATVFAALPATRLFHDDANGYERIGMALADSWHGRGPPVYLSTSNDQNYGYFYVAGGIYYIFGRCRVAASAVNSLVGALTVMLVYRLARQLFHIAVARRAALLTAFIPSMILWSSVALKDPVMTFFIVLAISSAVSLRRRFSFAALAGTVVPVAAMQPIRFYIVYFLVAAIVVAFLFDRGARALVGVSKTVLTAVAVVAFLAFAGVAGRAQQGLENLDLERVSGFRQGMAATAESGFAQDADVSTPARALAFLPIGVAYLLLSPFPWNLVSLRASFAAPEMLLWWLLIPSLIRGLRLAVKERLGDCSPVLAFTLMLTTAYSLVQGNIGSGFRQRAQIFVFLFIFASLGRMISLCRKQGVDERRLLAPRVAPA